RFVTGEQGLRGLRFVRAAAVFQEAAERAFVALDDDRAENAAAFRHPLEDEARSEVAGPYPAISRRDRHAEEPRLPEQRDIVPRVSSLRSISAARAAIGSRANARALACKARWAGVRSNCMLPPIIGVSMRVAVPRRQGEQSGRCRLATRVVIR